MSHLVPQFRYISCCISQVSRPTNILCPRDTSEDAFVHGFARHSEHTAFDNNVKLFINFLEERTKNNILLIHSIMRATQ
jgi:hypothetical protein